MTNLLVKYSLLAFPVASTGLGVWQIKRLGWKKRLLADLDKQILEEPIELIDIKDAAELADFEYRRVKVRGCYDPDPTHQLFLVPRALIANEEAIYRGKSAHQSNNGVNVITPFNIEGTNRRILVNRGWLALKGKEAYKDNAHVGLGSKEPQELVGVVRKSDKKSTYGVHNNMTTKEWHIRDIDAMSKVLKTEPIYIDAEMDPKRLEGPYGGQTQVNIRNEHLNYAITWFSLGALTLVMWYGKYGRKSKMRGRS